MVIPRKARALFIQTNPIDKTNHAIDYCRENGLDLEIINRLPHKEWMKKLLEFEYYLDLKGFTAPDILSVSGIEAIDQGCKVLVDTNDIVTSFITTSFTEYMNMYKELLQSKVFYINPERVFNTEKPHIPIEHFKSWEYYDRDGIGINNYLQVLTSIALHGMKYAVPITKSFKNLDGNFRVYAAKELGMLLPVIFVNHDAENRHPFIYKWLWRFRKLIRRKHFLKRKWINPTWKWKNEKIVLSTPWQTNIL